MLLSTLLVVSAPFAPTHQASVATSASSPVLLPEQLLSKLDDLSHRVDTLNERVGRCVLISSDTEKSNRSGELMCCAPGSCCSRCLPCCMDNIMAPMMAGQMNPDKM